MQKEINAKNAKECLDEHLRCFIRNTTVILFVGLMFSFEKSLWWFMLICLPIVFTAGYHAVKAIFMNKYYRILMIKEKVEDKLPNTKYIYGVRLDVVKAIESSLAKKQIADVCVAINAEGGNDLIFFYSKKSRDTFVNDNYWNQDCFEEVQIEKDQLVRVLVRERRKEKKHD